MSFFFIPFDNIEIKFDSIRVFHKRKWIFIEFTEFPEISESDKSLLEFSQTRWNGQVWERWVLDLESEISQRPEFNPRWG